MHSGLQFIWAEWGTLLRSVARLCPTLCGSTDCSPPGSSVHGILQARIQDWGAMPSSRRSSWPRDWTRISLSPVSAGEFFTISTTWNPVSNSVKSSTLFPLTTYKAKAVSFSCHRLQEQAPRGILPGPLTSYTKDACSWNPEILSKSHPTPWQARAPGPPQPREERVHQNELLILRIWSRRWPEPRGQGHSEWIHSCAWPARELGLITAVNWGCSNPNRFVAVAQASRTAREAFGSDKWGLCWDKGGS